MDKSTILKIVGGLFLLAGLALVISPELVSNKPVPDDTFKAIERRIWWGLLIGIGTLLLFHSPLKPLLPTVAATLSSLVFGLLIARLVGIVLDGSIIKQWLYVGIELIVFAPLLWWYLKIRT